MAKRKKRRLAQQTKSDREQPLRSNEPWLSRRTGLTVMVLFSLAFAAFVVWQLAPSEGAGRAILWGLGFGLGIWAVFGLALAFNTWVRRRR